MPAAWRSPGPMQDRCGWSRGAPGASSRRSSPRPTTCCRRTTSRRIPIPSSLIGHRRPISVFCCSRPAPPATIERLKRFRGHFFNWYDTSDLRPLEPAYISSVDSGNLAGHLIALANTCAAWRGTLTDATGIAAGAADSLVLARDALQALPDDRRTQLVTSQELAAALADLAATLLQHPDRLDELALHAGKAADLARTLANERADAASEDMLFWVEAAQRSIDSHRRDVAQEPESTAALERRLQTVEATSRTMANAMEFDFLLNRERR